IGLLIFAWGGGVLTLGGMVTNLLTGHPLLSQIFRFDPGWGWWFLNLGRNLLYPTEAWYHVLFFGSIFLLLKKKHAFHYLLSFILVITHPFTGVELILILLAWGVFEKLIIKSTELPMHFIVIQLLLLIILYLHYFILPGNNPEHQQCIQQVMNQIWLLPLTSIVLAYLPIAILLLFGFLKKESFRDFFKKTHNRLFLFWFMVSFGLANHELFVTPHQPVHFTRGYIWSALVLMGIPQILKLFHWTPNKSIFKIIVIFIFLSVIFSDNLIWFAHKGLSSHNSKYGVFITHPQKDLFAFLNNEKYHRSLFISQEHQTNYLATVYTPLRSWVAHMFNTPDYDRKQSILNDFFVTGAHPPEWKGKQLLIAFNKNKLQQVAHTLHANKIIFSNEDYVLITSKITHKE
ncbi:MAG: hypothetical protein HQK83_17685, partial [Fibrobacteria bacterium]|nr:hypothetical protein [Fibrobacteria bacterium]